MSFKREGNDLSLLANLQRMLKDNEENVILTRYTLRMTQKLHSIHLVLDGKLCAILKRQRVAELLATHIPEDEAILLKNGRYSCVVCGHRPIFDTLDVLAIHRRGRKHLANLSKFLANRELKKKLIEKRKHEAGNTTVSQSKCSSDTVGTKVSSSLLKAAPYTSCCKRRHKPTDRKLVLDIKLSKTSASNPLATPSNRTEVKAESPDECLVKSYIKNLQSKESFQSRVERSRRLGSTSYVPCTNSSICEADNDKDRRTVNVKKTDVRLPLDEEQTKKANYYINLNRDGWKQNLDGMWFKDEDAEFDSDEETPPAYDTYK